VNERVCIVKKANPGGTTTEQYTWMGGYLQEWVVRSFQDPDGLYYMIHNRNFDKPLGVMESSDNLIF